MHLSEILKALYGKSIHAKLKFLNQAVYITKNQFPPETYFIHLGVTFLTKNGREFEVFYNWLNQMIVKQPVYHNLYRICGLVYGTDEHNEYITSPRKLMLTGVSNDNSLFKYAEVDDKYFLEFGQMEKMPCYDLENSEDKFEIDSFIVFDKENYQTLKNYPLTFKQFEVYYNSATNKYEKLLDIEPFQDEHE